MGEVRKRKPSKEQTVNGNSEVKVVESGGLGLIPVVLIAAVLAGSGCYVIKKDHAENFADLQKLTNQLKADNSNTLKAVDAMKSAIEQKDKIIKELQQKVNSGNEKNRLTDDKLNDIMSQVEEGTKGAQARQTKIEALEIALETAKKSTAASTEELRNLVETKSADNAELTAQSAKLAEVSGEISKINEKIEEGASVIAKLSAENVAIKEDIKDINDVRAALPKVTAQLESLSETVDDVASKTPSETLLVTLKTSTQKASEKIAAALADISSNSAEIQNLKTSGEKELAELASRIATVVENSKKDGSAVSALKDSLDSAQNIITALGKDIEGLNKKYGELSKKISAK